MPFILNISFTGMCLFCDGDDPDVWTSPKYVLFPATGGPGDAPGVPQHVPLLCVDTAYLRPGSERGTLAAFALAGTSLSFESTARLDRSLAEAPLANIALVTDGPIAPRLLGGDPGPLLAGRIELRSGRYAASSTAAAGKGACWAYPDAARLQMMSTEIDWSIEYPDRDQLDLVLTRFGTEVESRLPTLHPIGEAAPEITLHVYNTPWDYLPLNPNPPPLIIPDEGEEETDFGAYYRLFRDPVREGWPNPRYHGIDCAKGASGGPYTCMGAMWEPPPV